MHPRVQAARKEVALRDMVDASARLAEKLGLSGGATAVAAVSHRDPQIRDMLRFEALAAFLSDLDARIKTEVAGETSNDVVMAKLEAVGVSESWRESIRKKLEAGEETVDETVEATQDVEGA